VKTPNCFVLFVGFRQKFVLILCQHRTKLERLTGVFLLLYAFCLPEPLFRSPTCMLLEDRQGNLLGARVAADDQWRFPLQAGVCDKFAACIVAFEDHRFYQHLGIDPVGLCRALVQDVRNGKVVSGGSTISMQVIRLAHNDDRTFLNKAIELFLATRLEYRYSKTEILGLYAANAPFGGNVVGIDAAAWRYYGKSPTLLSWSEAATLAVLPNAPALIHPGRNRTLLLQKRNRLLLKLRESGTIDNETYRLALEEPLPDKPHDLPNAALHLLDRAYKNILAKAENTATRLRSTLAADLQQQAADIAERYHNELKANDINNLACMIMDTETGEVLAYIGNVGSPNDIEHGAQVDVITAPRSTGSIMKPYLYALMQEEGLLLPKSLVPDIPTTILGYRPENYSQTFEGVAPAQLALARSLNIPAVRELHQYGVARFHQRLREMGITTLTHTADYYGLPLILGGAEAKLWDLMGIYANMGRTLNHFAAYNSRYDATDWRPPHYIYNTIPAPCSNFNRTRQAPKLSAGAIWTTFDAMQQVERPTSEGAWEVYEGTRRVAWKTGTSWGGRDAWAIGVTPRYTVGVWIGNGDGEGRPGLIGVVTAAPVLFDLFSLLPQTAWWQPPYDDMTQVATCHESGFRVGKYCTHIDTVWAAKRGNEVRECPYHQIIHLDATGNFRVTSACESTDKMQHLPFFVLPALEEQFYKGKHPDYVVAPPFRADCAEQNNAANDVTNSPMQWVYPRQPTRILVPIDYDGQPQATVFEIAHRRPATKVFWYLDNEFIATTTQYHQQSLRPAVGKHTLTLTDATGARLVQQFEIVASARK
jgi:penicillin-binding protein 1C